LISSFFAIIFGAELTAFTVIFLTGTGDFNICLAVGLDDFGNDAVFLAIFATGLAIGLTTLIAFLLAGLTNDFFGVGLIADFLEAGAVFLEIALFAGAGFADLLGVLDAGLAALLVTFAAGLTATLPFFDGAFFFVAIATLLF
jgi:hypothetical protein